jgi:protein-S-isoprenylcysteine O-methyltransferase Ste14
MVAMIWLGVAGATAFRRAHTTIDPHRPEQASSLVVDGIYRVTRNPMYLGADPAVLLIGHGDGFAYGSHGLARYRLAMSMNISYGRRHLERLGRCCIQGEKANI